MSPNPPIPNAPPPGIVAILGPTGVGKTAIALAVGAALDAEIVSADSRQVYRGLDIGSAKPTAAEQQRVRHHLIDVVGPDERFDCARFRTLALAAITDIVARGKRVLLVGGTGLYVKAVVRGLVPVPGRDPVVRARLEAAEAALPGTLHTRLATVDPVLAARLHPHDIVRIVRALEVYELSGRPLSSWHAAHCFSGGDVEALLLGLTLPRPALYARIDARCEAMLRDGLVEEVRRLYTAGYDAGLPALRSPGYREAGAYLRGECDLTTARARMAQATRRLAKRQMTWCRGEAALQWLPPDAEVVIERARAFWDRPPGERVG